MASGASLTPATYICVALITAAAALLAHPPSANRLRSWLAARVRWDSVERVQQVLRCKAADIWFSAFPFLGNEIQYVLLLPATAWFLDDAGATARHLSLGAFIGCYLSNAAKTQMRLPRPPLKLHVGKGSTVSEKARQEHERIAEQYGFPSTHSAHALLLGTIFGRALLSPGLGRQAFVLVHTAHVGLSRLYMGVHSLADVLGGLLVGALLAFGAFEPLGLLSDAAVTFEETVSFAGVHLGLVFACALARDDAPRAAFVASLRAPGGSIPAVLAATVMTQLVTGLLVLGMLRTGLSAAAKKAVARLVPAGRLNSLAGMVRVLLVNLSASAWVMGMHPARLLEAAASLKR
ncbi:hypothetical protein Ctob_004451 [Chrysochromulina tobinii]|uniref:Phosphatidic acid phosphatase type 2/haloperoxidase domain-containing protein n=1 Tax=Chrysochromulina tobinii TaxID=1460289 RepID=A0A0M0JGR8_9EUKA|nr:hypothetical protein Ctob_004451 [Chrysochromulina tobinii]|eukprot:KOO25779.1 hypothetical protein Ctob_004451 [Chrysochromulina sp. CCMP291]